MTAEFSHQLSAAEVFRYSRQILVDEFGPEGQQQLRDSSLLIVGAGALGSPFAVYCAAAGISRLGIIDSEKLSMNDLCRGLCHYGSSIGTYKALSVKASVSRVNTLASVVAYCKNLDSDNSCEIIRNYDYVADCTNNFHSRQLLHQTCAKLKKPLLSASVNVQGGSLSFVVFSKLSSCHHCVFPDCHRLTESQASECLIGPVSGVVGCMMAVELVKLASSVVHWEPFLWKASSCKDCETLRYHREISLEAFTINENRSFENTSLLIVGAGGLGSPLALYCAAAGIGRIGIVDEDIVSLDNLHRQIVHTEKNVGISKVTSVQQALLSVNSRVRVDVHNLLLDSSNAAQIVEDYDIVADCSDNVPTRYLVSDVCAMSKVKKPVVSGSALAWDGQMTIYNHEKMPLCFRCLHPQPPPVSCTANCSDSGVIGPVVGVIGSLQALEVLRIAGGFPPEYAGKLFIYDGLNGCSRSVVLRSRKESCPVCGNYTGVGDLSGYCEFCSSKPNDKAQKLDLLDSSDRLTPIEASRWLSQKDEMRPFLIDTRPSHQFRIGHLKNAINFIFDDLVITDAAGILSRLEATSSSLMERKVIVICRRGNHSQLAVVNLREKFLGLPTSIFKDIIGGYTSWQQCVDTSFPIY